MDSPLPYSDQVRWLTEEVLPHKPAVRAYLLERYPELPDADDMVEESLVRVMRVRARGGVASAKALLFATARNLARDAMRRQRVLTFESITEARYANAFTDGTDVAASVSRQDDRDHLFEAIRALPARCRQVVILRIAHGLSQKEVAAQLAITENTVEKQMTIGIRRCDRFFATRGLL